MKKIITFLLLCAGLTSHAQINYNFCLTPAAVTGTDSVTMVATLLASDGYNYISWTDSAGPMPVILPAAVNSWGNSMLEQSTLTIHKLIPGQYIWKATGLSAGSTTGAVYDTLNVISAPLPRTVTGIIVSLYGVVIPIPAGQGTKISLSDGTTQTY